MTTDSSPEGEAIRTGNAVSFTTKLHTIPALDPELVAKLAQLGIADSATLLARGATPEGRAEICNTMSIDQVQLLKALYMMDLERVDGVSWTNAALLAAAGVTTVPDLAFRTVEDLVPQLQRANAELGLLKRLPSAKVVKGWIDHAKGLPQALSFEGTGEVY